MNVPIDIQFQGHLWYHYELGKPQAKNARVRIRGPAKGGNI